MRTERIYEWLKSKGFDVDQMLGGEVEDLVVCILDQQPLDVKARRDAEQAARELLVMAEQTLELLKLNKQVLYHPKVRESLGRSVAQLNTDISSALEDHNNARILKGEDPIIAFKSKSEVTDNYPFPVRKRKSKFIDGNFVEYETYECNDDE